MKLSRQERQLHSHGEAGDVRTGGPPPDSVTVGFLRDQSSLPAPQRRSGNEAAGIRFVGVGGWGSLQVAVPTMR